jgi:hypothetical protein
MVGGAQLTGANYGRSWTRGMEQAGMRADCEWHRPLSPDIGRVSARKGISIATYKVKPLHFSGCEDDVSGSSKISGFLRKLPHEVKPDSVSLLSFRRIFFRVPGQVSQLRIARTVRSRLFAVVLTYIGPLIQQSSGPS